MTITIIPKDCENLYGMLIAKEKELRPKGAFYRVPSSFRASTKWHHKDYDGWVWLSKGMRGVVIAMIESRNRAKAWEILSDFVGFLDKYFRDEIAAINIHYSLE